MSIEEAGGTAELKRELRRRLLAARASRAPDERTQAAQALSQRVLGLPEIQAAATVTCYVSMQTEPGTGPLLEHLATTDRTVLLPLLGSDFDLSWAPYQPGTLRTGRLGLSEPTTPPLGTEAVTGAAVVICPGLAVDMAGHRIGRGGGSYDRALRRLPDHVLRVVLLYDDEVLADVPVDRDDEPVHVVVTPSRTLRLDQDRVS